MDARDWDARYAGTELVWSAAPNAFVESELRDLPPGRALDLAAGEGRNSLWLASLGWRVTAVDFSPVALDKGRAAETALGSGPPVDWVCADVLGWEGLEGIDRPDDGWDLVVVAYLQLPADQRTRAVRGAFRALRPGGTLLWVAHDATNLVEGTGGPQDPDVLMSAEDVLADLGDEDFEVIRAERVPRTVEPGHGGEPQRTAYDCLVRLRRP
jgi:SAM-dependent methyltransferase